WYVPQRHDFDLLPSANRPIVIGEQRGGSPSTTFRKPKVFETYDQALEAGMNPPSFSIWDPVRHRVRSGEKLTGHPGPIQGLQNIPDQASGQPIAIDIPQRRITRPDGSSRMVDHVPRDYEAVEVTPGVRLAIYKTYARGVSAMTSASQIAASAPMAVAQELAA